MLVLLAIYRLGQTVLQSRVEHWQNLAHAIPGLGGEARLQVSDCGMTEWIPVSRLNPGDIVIVGQDEVIPVDGKIRDGRAYVEELPLTGEPFPVPRDIGDHVKAGTRVLDGEIRVEATVCGTAREIDRLSASLKSVGRESRSEKLARRILKVFVPVVLASAAGTLLYWGIASRDWDRAVFNALAVTIVACPCGLGLAIPLTANRGRFSLRLLGIRGADSDLLDRLAEIDTVVFDKTGTLSAGRLELSRWEVADDAPDSLGFWLAAIQRTSTHPVARLFWDVAEPAKLEKLEVQSIPARGIEARFTYEAVSHTLVVANSLYRPDESEAEHGADLERRKLHIHLDGKRVATVTLAESSRATTRETMAVLRERGTRVEIMTGDATVPPELASRADSVRTGVSSQQKSALVRGLREQGRSVLFVGDGLNDAEALRAANAALAIDGGSPAATGSANAILEHGNLLAIPEALEFANTQRRRIQRLLRFVLGYNVIGIILASTGWLHPVVAALLMLGSSVTVLARSGR